MATMIKTAVRYLRYLLRAKTRYYIHSPFVFDFIENVTADKRYYYAFDDIDYLRNKLLAARDKIAVTDYGAGSKKFKKGTEREIGDIVRHASVSSRIGQLLFKTVCHFQPNNILELGTSMGISTLYLAKASPSAKVVTIEGSTTLAMYAQRNFEILKAGNIEVKTGKFEYILPVVLNELGNLDLFFFDGNHDQKATLQYFESCLPYIKGDACFIFDDIHWSEGMQSAWNTIKAHPKVAVSIDLFSIGLVFFREGQAKEDFTLYYF